MPILQIGVSHRRAPLDLLERLAFDEGDLPKAYRRLADDPHVREAVLLSTCNRVEVYADVASYHAGSLALRGFLSADSAVSPDELAAALVTGYQEQAVEHLFLVAAGMDSMVLGEPQILGQVREAHRRAEEEGTSGPVLAALFRAAVRAGRRVRAEAGLGAPPAAFIGAGLDEAELRLGSSLRGRPAAVVGAGRMARLAAEALRDRGAERIHVVNRTPSRAASLAARVDGPASGLDRLGDVLRDVDVAVLCTAAPSAVVTALDARAAVIARAAGRVPALFLIDLAVPRNAEAGVRDVHGIAVADIDDLRERLRRGRPGTPVADLDRARAVIGEETRRFEDRQEAARLAPLIRALHASGERAVAAELRRAGPRLSRLEPEEREAVEALARGLVAKLLHTPTVRVKELTGRGRGDAAARALADLFGVEYPPGA